MKSFKLGLRFLYRERKSTALRILFLSVVLAVATVTSINIFTSRIQNSLYDEAKQLLAGDVKITGSSAIPQEWLVEAKQRDLDTAHIMGFSSMVFFKQEMVLAQIKAVSESYPLKGQLEINREVNAPTIQLQHGPTKGEVWLAPRLLNALNLTIGEKIVIGDGEFTVTHILQKEPDRAQSFIDVAPRIMMHISDIPKTNAIQLGSRINYTLVLAGEQDSLDQFKDWITPNLGHHYRWLDIKTSNRSVSDTLAKAENFILLAGCLSVILGCTAIALSSFRYTQFQIKTVALLKTLGYTPNQIIVTFIAMLLTLGVFAIAIGLLCGWALHWVIILALSNLLTAAIADPSLDAYWLGIATGMISLLAFAAPPFLRLKNVSPISAINSQYLQKSRRYVEYLLAFSAVAFLIYLYSQSISLTVYLLLGMLGCLSGVFALSWLSIRVSRYIAKRSHHSIRIGLNNLQRHRASNAFQIVIFSLIFLLVSVLLIARTQLIQQWQNQLPEDAANHFVFNVFTEELPEVKNYFSREGISHNPFYPMTRGRVIHVNGIDVKTLQELHKKNRINYHRELNLTWSESLGKDNNIVQGQWWDTFTPKDENEFHISIEKEYASGIGVELGDLVTISIAGQEVNARVASIRSVQWDSMNPNFFIIFRKPIGSEFGANWLTSFYLPKEKKNFINQLARNYPGLSIIELDQTIDTIKEIVQKVSAAIEFILLLILLAGILVLVATIQSTLETRFKEGAILRTLGGNKKLIRGTLIVEFAAIGLIAGLLATIATETTSFFLQSRIFKLNYESLPVMWALIPVCSTLLIALVGWLSTRRVVTAPPMTVLKSI